MYYTYVLLSEKDGKHYIGYTSNLKLRPARFNDSENQNRRFYLTGFEQHSNGEVESTCYRRPFKLIYYTELKNMFRKIIILVGLTNIICFSLFAQRISNVQQRIEV